jgi:hypothetical protein
MRTGKNNQTMNIQMDHQMMKDEFKAMKAVYSYVFPEIRPIIAQMSNLPIDLFLTSTPVNKAQDIIDGLGFRERLIVPANARGNVSLDDIHEPIIDRIIQEYEFHGERASKHGNVLATSAISGINNFAYRYPTSGSSQGIFHLLADAKQKGIDTIYVLSGEYEGYKEYGATLGIKTIEVDSLENKCISKYASGKNAPGLWFISNPSARDGNIIPNSQILNLCDQGHKVILDLAYVGMTKDYTFDLNHENIVGAVMSLSKPYGLFRFRTGFTFTREPIQSLYANKWFKDVGRLLLGLKVVEDIGTRRLYDAYAGAQSKIITGLNEKFGLTMKKSDVLLLSHMTSADVLKLDDDRKSLIADYGRSGNYRFCLTPYYEALENSGNPNSGNSNSSNSNPGNSNTGNPK